MESVLYVLVATHGDDERDQLLLNLSPNRPVLEEDVPLQWQSQYRALEFLSSPSSVLSLENLHLVIAWPSTGDGGHYLSSLQESGVRILAALEAYEDGGYCYLGVGSDRQSAAYRGPSGEEEVFSDLQRVVALLSRVAG